MEHDLAGVHEVAELLGGISRQRVHQLAAEHEDFPKPIAILRAGKIWLRSDIADWRAGRDRPLDDRQGDD